MNAPRDLRGELTHVTLLPASKDDVLGVFIAHSLAGLFDASVDQSQRLLEGERRG